MKLLSKIILGFLITIVGAIFFTIIFYENCSGLSSISNGANSAYTDSQVGELFGVDGVFTKIISILLFLVGVMSVVMLVVGGIRYTISGGNAHAISGAKNTILYAIVGIVASLISYAIVNFVLSSLLTSDSGSY